jgi:hypothetical protein
LGAAKKKRSRGGEVLGNLVDHLVQSVGVVALLISAGLLILVSNRDAFEVDIKPRQENDPAGGSRLTWQWKYMSDYAEHARLELLGLVNAVLVVTRTLMIVVLLLALISGLMDVAGYFGFQQVADEIKADPWVQLVFDHGVGLLFVAFAPILVFQLVRVVSDVVRARDVPQSNKPSSWTAWPISEGEPE